MNFIIKKGRLNSTILFIATGSFLIITFGYQLLMYLETNEFIIKFPGDWDKPFGILVGIFLIVRSQRFKNQRKDLFIKLNENKLEFRTKESENTQKIDLQSIHEIHPTEDGIIIKTKENQIIMNLTSIKSEKKMKEIRKTIIESIANKKNKTI